MLKYIFIFITFIHGITHFRGFLAGFGYGNVFGLTNQISQSFGILWLMTGMLFILCTIYLMLKKDIWIWFTLTAIGFSQILISYSWEDAMFDTIPNIIILIVAILGIFQMNFKNNYRNEVKIGLSKTKRVPNEMLEEQDIQDLPTQVQKYIRYTQCIGKPKVNNFRVDFEGKIRSHDNQVWMNLISEQYNFVNTTTRLFYLDAIMKGLPVAGFHCFKNAKAYMDIRLLSIFKVEYQDGSVMDVSETVTFFNDMCVMAPATLIDKRIKWLEVDDYCIKALFTNNGITILALLYFDNNGELINFVSEDRSALLKDGKTAKMQWSTPMRDYKIINGYKLASNAEAIYRYPSGDFVYATFSVRDVRYNLLE